MALPSIEQDWQRDYNLSNTVSGVLETDTDNLFILIWNSMRGFASNPWTVVGSSNGTTATMDGTNRLTSVANIVHANAASAHSWGVLENADGVQVCYDFANTGVERMGIIWSPAAGFTGGSTTARPTATDEQILNNPTSGNQWQGGIGGTGGQFRAHVMHTEDGTCTRVYICMSGNPVARWSFEHLLNGTPASWTPVCASTVSVTSPATVTLLNYTNFVDVAKYASKGIAAATMPLHVCQAAAVGDPLQNALNAADQASGEYPICSVGAWSNSTTGQLGFRGYFADMFFTVPVLINGDTFPADGSHIFTVLGDEVIPTGGQTLLLG